MKAYQQQQQSSNEQKNIYKIKTPTSKTEDEKIGNGRHQMRKNKAHRK